MIKNNESKVEITTRNIKYYNDRGYSCYLADIITIDVSTMPKMSHNKVIAICEMCFTEIELPFSKYNKNKERYGFYSCKKCSYEKRKITNKEKYGVENNFKREDVREKNKNWMSSDEFKEKSKKSLIEKFGVDSYSKTIEFRKMISEFNISNRDYLREKRENTCLEKYGYKSILEIPGLKENAMFEKYGASYSFLVPEIKEKIQNINLNTLGHTSPFGNEEIRKKSKKKLIELYGVDNVFKIPEIQKQIKSNREKMFVNIDLKEIERYRRSVRHLTKKYKEELIEKWSGYDYYDGEYIKNNFMLDKNDPSYPTIDHKISIFFGFINKISVEEISRIENLCLTKRILNLKKKALLEEQFLDKQTKLN
jgi:hypothetical protein